MKAYHDLLERVIETGERVKARPTLLSDGSRPDCFSLFGQSFEYDLAEGFPLITTKKVWWHGVIHELVWFIRGETNIKYLLDNDVHIWDSWSSPDGELGPVYGRQWRNFEGVDQLQGVLNNLRAIKEDPHHSSRRRLVVSAWNPKDVPSMALPPCHTLYQFLPTNGRLNCHLFCRSIDTFLGLPFNIASYAALTHYMAAMSGMEVGVLKLSITDLHVYENHIEQARIQLERREYPLPTLQVTPSSLLDDVSVSNFVLTGYRHHPALKAEVAV